MRNMKQKNELSGLGFIERNKMELSKTRKLALLFFVGTIFFITGLVIIPDIKIQLYVGNLQSPFVIIGLSFFLVGSYLGFKK